MISKTRQNKLESYIPFIILAFFSIIFLAPFFFMLVSSFKPGQELFRNGLNSRIQFDIMSLKIYKMLFWGDARYLQWFKSSLIITFIYTILSLLLSSMVGYGLAVYNFKGKNLLFFIVLLVMMVPLEILLLPLYRLMITLKLIDTYMGVILPFAVSPFGIFFFRQYILGIPKDFIEAARIDGCSEFRIFFRIVVPLIKPAYGAMTILLAMINWNSFVWPLIVLRSTEHLTLPVGLASLITPYGNNYEILMPGAVMAVIPIAIIFLLNQRAFIEGLTAGGIKQ
ncbi:MAG: carbohydrate ABC transporter permease [Nitrososphaeraceae archaeon]|nr:carbohydrate ABC transporter permease [Nitrososphaeraceae archaeon]